MEVFVANLKTTPRPTRHITDRLVDNDKHLTRLDITASLLQGYTRWEREAFFAALQSNHTVTHVHLSGEDLESVMPAEEIVLLIDSIGYLEQLTELFVFRGDCEALTGERVGQCLSVSLNVKVLMLWGFTLAEELPLAAAIRSHPNLTRVTLTIPKRLPYAALDVYAMGLAMMKKLKCLSIRCNCRQFEPIFSPEALTILMGSTSIDSLYLENIGLTDDHSDAIALELPNNKTLTLLDIKHNLFSDDALFAFAIGLKQNSTLKSLDLSGVSISPKGVYTLAEALQYNTTITNLELEGDAVRFRDEFNVPEGHSQSDYMQALNFQLRLNRAGPRNTKASFVEALNMVSDHVGCLFHLVKKHANYFEGTHDTPPGFVEEEI